MTAQRLQIWATCGLDAVVGGATDTGATVFTGAEGARMRCSSIVPKRTFRFALCVEQFSGDLVRLVNVRSIYIAAATSTRSRTGWKAFRVSSLSLHHND